MEHVTPDHFQHSTLRWCVLQTVWESILYIQLQSEHHRMEQIFRNSPRRKCFAFYIDVYKRQESSYLIVKEDGDYDGKFTGYAKENNIPITLVQQTKNTVTVFTDLFAK